MKPPVFVDTDVIISATISQNGAAYELLTSGTIEKFITNYVVSETLAVAGRMNLDSSRANSLISQCKKITLESKRKTLEKNYAKHASDINDTHIVAGAVKSGSKFLVTYNLKHYNIELIKRDFDIIVLIPGLFLQYLRSKD